MQAFRAVRSALWSLALLAGVAVTTACAGTAHDRPYDAKADARGAIAGALADNPGRKRVLLTFGANWCGDSRALERHYQRPELAALLAREFKVVHIDIGMNHRNQDLVAEYGNPTDKGIPSVVLLDADGKTLFVNHGTLSSAESMSVPAVDQYFERLARDGRVD
jgi:thiol-disulfide isomerase/thioredoxin